MQECFLIIHINYKHQNIKSITYKNMLTLIWSSHCFHWASVRSVDPNTLIAYCISWGSVWVMLVSELGTVTVTGWLKSTRKKDIYLCQAIFAPIFAKPIGNLTARSFVSHIYLILQRIQTLWGILWGPKWQFFDAICSSFIGFYVLSHLPDKLNNFQK